MDEPKESNIFNWLQKFHRCFGEPSEAKVRVQSLLRPSFDLGTKTCAFVTFHEFWPNFWPNIPYSHFWYISLRFSSAPPRFARENSAQWLTCIGKAVFATEKGGQSWIVEACGSTAETTGPGSCLWTLSWTSFHEWWWGCFFMAWWCAALAVFSLFFKNFKSPFLPSL